MNKYKNKHILSSGGIADKVSTGVGTAISLIGNAMNQAQVNDATSLKLDIQNSAPVAYTNGMSFDDVISQYQTTPILNSVNAKTFRPDSLGKDFLNSFTAGLEGSSAGFSIGGGVGAIIGGVAGTASSWAGSLAGRAKAKREAESANKLIAQQNTFNNNMLKNNTENAINSQRNTLLANMAAEGGPLETQGTIWDNGIKYINNGGTHRQNPNGGVPMGIAPDGIPNLVEEGEVVYNDYVFSNRLSVPSKLKEKHHYKKDSTYADAAKKAMKEAEERPNDPISKNGLMAELSELQSAQEEYKIKKELRKQKEAFKNLPEEKVANALGIGEYAEGGHMFVNGGLSDYLPGDRAMTKKERKNFIQGMATQIAEKPNALIWGEELPTVNNSIQKAATVKGPSYTAPIYNIQEMEADNNINNKDNWMRYAPIIGNTVGTLMSAGKPDYSKVNELKQVANTAAQYDRVGFNPIGNYLTYKPFDLNYTANQLRASEQANARNIMNTSGGNRGTAMAGLLANSYNSQIALGNAYRQAAESNLAQRQAVEEFNRGTNQMNSQGMLSASQANQSARASANQLYGNLMSNAIGAAQSIDDNRAKAIMGNMTSMFDNIGKVGKEKYAQAMIDNNAGLQYDSMGIFKTFTPEQLKIQGYKYNPVTGEPFANGGYLTIKRRK